MNASYNWLKDFVPVDLTPEQLRDLITSRVATVDAVERLRADLEQIVVARVVEAWRHPNSDHLWVTKVDDGTGELLDVVCGAPNVTQGTLYPFARSGTVMPNGMKIERRKIRGETSNGMLCSARELGLGDEHDGILPLDVRAGPGTPFLEAVRAGDVRLVVDVNANRPDLLSHLGLAREIAAATGVELDWLGGRAPELTPEAADALRDAAAQSPAAVRALASTWTSGTSLVADPAVLVAEPAADARGSSAAETDGVRVLIEDGDACPRYLGAVIRGVRVGPSPDWLRERVEAVGGRSINNVVDVTNYMLHGFGQPMHAFDLARLGGRSVIVRRARAGERLTTLDGADRPLDPSMLVIADAQRAQALAGVMGGRDSEVGGATTDVFLEVAAFDGRTVRRTRRTLGIPSDAAYVFERGTDVEMADVWLRHAVFLIQQVAGGACVGPYADAYPRPATRSPVPLRVERVRRLLGEPVPAAEITALLSSVGFTVGVAPGTEMLTAQEELHVVAPTWRHDVAREVDLIEEVARLRGYDTFPNELRPYRPGNVPDDPMHVVGQRLRAALAAAGLYEVRPMPFVAGAPDGYVRVGNPLAENEAYLRREVLESLARRAEYNLAHMQRSVRLFEIGAAFAPGKRGELPHEEMRVALLVMGDRHPPHFTDAQPPAFDLWDAKGLAELTAANAFPGAAVELRPAGEGDVLWDVAVSGRVVGRVTRVTLDAPVWAAPAYGVEITLATVESGQVAPSGRSAASVPDARSLATALDLGGLSGRRAAEFRPLPAYPAADVDVALIVPDRVPAAEVERLMRQSGGDILEGMALLSEYRGPQVPSGHRSLAWRLTYRHAERTLSTKEVEGRKQRLLKTLETELGVRQRA